MRIAFFGTPPDAVPYLDAITGAGADIVLVISQPDRRRRRGAGSDPSPVKAAALERGLAVLTPERAGEIADDLAAAAVDLAVVVAFGQLLPGSLLTVVPDRFVNVHYSLLPRWRGAAPVERAILAGDPETGVCLMRIEAGLDTGPVYARAATPIDGAITAGELRARLTDLGTALLVEHLDRLPAATPDPQTGDATHADKLTVEEFRLDPNRSAVDLHRAVRAGNPRPGAWFDAPGTRVKVWTATIPERDVDVPLGTITREGLLGTAAGVLALDTVQPAGKRPMSAAAWLAGRRGPLTVA